MNPVVSNEILATQFRNFLKLRTLDGYYACKEEATSANAQDARKKGHFTEKIFVYDTNSVVDGRKSVHTEPDRCIRRYRARFFCSMSRAHITLCVR
jgi:hypothetical protein